MPRDPATALTGLLRTVTIDDPDETLKAANAAIKANRHDELAQHTKVVALLKLDRFEDALRAISELEPKLAATCLLEKTYSLYKADKLNEAATAIHSTTLKQRSLEHIAAQVAYRAEKFDDAETTYRYLADHNAAQEGHDLSINISAVRAQIEWKVRTSARALSLDTVPSTFELCYNTACAYIAQSSLKTAAYLLQRAAHLCEASEDLDEQAKAAELGPIRGQQAVVHTQLGDALKAWTICQSLSHFDDDDPEFSLVAQANMLALDMDRCHPFLLQRRTASWVAKAPMAKLFNFQSVILQRNLLLADLEVHKTDGVRGRTLKMLKQTRQPTLEPDINLLSVINAASKAKGLCKGGLLRRIVALSKNRPNDVGLIITTAQLYMQNDNPGAALNVLDRFSTRLDHSTDERDKQVRFSPGLVALRVSLMRIQGRESSAKAELVKAVTFWRDKPVACATSLLREASLELVKSSSPADLSLAASAFRRLREEQLDSLMVSAGLVAALAPTDSLPFEQQVAQFPTVQSMIGSIDVNALTSAGPVAMSGRTSNSLKSKRPASQDPAGEKAAKRKSRKRLPKHAIEGKTPDPERWLPLRDRSTFRPKGKKGKKKATDLTQGGMVKEEEKLDLVGGGGVRVEKTGATNAAKKKKKGRK